MNPDPSFAGKPRLHFSNKIDVIFIIFIITLSVYYGIYISSIKIPTHDGAVYLLNARSWFYGTEIDQEYRPQLLSWIISAIWKLTGENWIIAKYIQSAFTIGAGIILYIFLRKSKNASFAFGVSALTMLNAIVFVHSTKILTEGVALFFIIATLYLLNIRKEKYWLLAGITAGLTFAARYPVALQALTIFIVESIITKKPNLIIRTILSASFIILIVIVAIYLKTGTFQTAISEDAVFTIYLSPYYVANSIDIWGFAFLLVPLALLFKRTYTDKFNYTFIAWFIVSMIFWSANASNHQYRFAIQFTPAVYFLSMLGIENLWLYLKEKRSKEKAKATGVK